MAAPTGKGREDAHAVLVSAARRAERLGVLGGSFDPPHLGHLHVARRAREAFDLDHVVFVPAARPPHKPTRRLASGEERVAMLERLLADEPDASIWTVELGRSGPSYTVDTLRALDAARDAGGRTFLLLGSDNLAGLAGWRELDEILRRARPVVVARAGARLDPETLAGLDPAAARERIEAGFLPGEPFEAASTDLRARLAAGDVPAELFPPALREYLARHGIYRDA